MSLYHIVTLGQPSDGEAVEFHSRLKDVLADFALFQDTHWTLFTDAGDYRGSERVPAVAVYFGSENPPSAEDVEFIGSAEVPVIPYVTDRPSAQKELPKSLERFNAVFRQPDPVSHPVGAADAALGVTQFEGNERLVASTLEALGLLPRQRRVFISYRQITSRAAALQLYNMLSARGFDVFLDTHSIGKGVDFQEDLMHRLSNVDVMLLLDSPDFFKSDWTSAEFARACTRNLGILCVNWPGVDRETRMDIGWHLDLAAKDLRGGGKGKTMWFRSSTLKRICDELERFRSLSLAMRRLSMQATLEAAVRAVGGSVQAVGPQFVTHVALPRGQEIHITPVLGAPTSEDVEAAVIRQHCQPSAILYDHVGLRKRWLDHMGWLDKEIQPARWIRIADVAKELRK